MSGYWWLKEGLGKRPAQQLRYLPGFMGNFKYQYLATCLSPLQELP